MQIVHVFVEVLPQHIDAFRQATIINARESRREPGVIRFELYQEEEAPHKFLLIEIYRDLDAPAQHKQTGHYALWRDTVAPMMAQPRRSVHYLDIFPHAV